MSSDKFVKYAFADYKARYLWLHEIELDLRLNGEHGLANLVEDRRRAILNWLTPEEAKEVAVLVYEREEA